jgi:hypothetical protein
MTASRSLAADRQESQADTNLGDSSTGDAGSEPRVRAHTEEIVSFVFMRLVRNPEVFSHPIGCLC